MEYYNITKIISTLYPQTIYFDRSVVSEMLYKYKLVAWNKVGPSHLSESSKLVMVSKKVIDSGMQNSY